MPEITPFKAYRYNAKKFKDMTEVLAPPYDVITPEEQELLYQKSPYNYVRLDLKKRTQGEDIYSRTADELAEWIEKEVFVPEKNAALYVYVQDYKNLAGKAARRVGFMSIMKINDRLVKKHERTLDGPKEDRTMLLRALQANMSPIMGFYEDRKGTVHKELLATTKQKPVIDVKMASVRHRVYLECNTRRIIHIQKLLKKKPMYIADGHHRFEVSHSYYLTRKKQGTVNGAGPAYVLTYLCSAEKNDMTIYPTHRVLKLDAGWFEQLKQHAHKKFNPKQFRSLKALTTALKTNAQKSIGLIVGEKKLYYVLLTPKKKKHELDADLAQREIIAPLLKGVDVAKTNRMRYTRSPEQANTWIKNGECQLAVLLSKIPIQEVMRISDRGGVMPQKSTYFYPKLLSGLVFYKF